MGISQTEQYICGLSQTKQYICGLSPQNAESKEAQEFEASLSYSWKPCLKINTKMK